MNSYSFLFDVFAGINTVMLIVYAILGIMVLKKTDNKKLKIVAFYLLFSCFFDILSKLYIQTFFSDTKFLSILYRLGELLIVGYLINKYWLKSTFFWALIGLSSIYLLYDLFTYRAIGVHNYTANAEIAANILLVVMIAFNLIKQLKSDNNFSVTSQMLSMVFLTYFSVHLIYVVITNFIINQNFSNNGFALFYCSYALLHIVYYFALALIVYKNHKPLTTKPLIKK